MKNILLLISLAFLISCNQDESQKIQKFKNPSSFFSGEKTQVLVVGTFHFEYYGLDAHKVLENDKIDILKEPKKSEITELVDYIKKFKPTKIAIEAFPNFEATEKLKKYKKGEYRTLRDERYQLGMRIAMEMKLDTLYSIDANAFTGDLEQLDKKFHDQLWKDYDWKSNEPIDRLMKQWYNYKDGIVKESNLLDYFKYMNSKESHQYGYGAYLIGDFKLDEHRGADVLSTYWYNRNLRIFRKLQEITENKKDRILVIFGNGHAAILRQLLESSPEYDFIEFDSL